MHKWQNVFPPVQYSSLGSYAFAIKEVFEENLQKTFKFKVSHSFLVVMMSFPCKIPLHLRTHILQLAKKTVFCDLSQVERGQPNLCYSTIGNLEFKWAMNENLKLESWRLHAPVLPKHNLLRSVERLVVNQFTNNACTCKRDHKLRAADRKLSRGNNWHVHKVAFTSFCSFDVLRSQKM